MPVWVARDRQPPWQLRCQCKIRFCIYKIASFFTRPTSPLGCV